MLLITSDPAFWFSLGQIMLINIVLSGDNAVVIALAARSLPHHQQRLAIIWGSVAAIALRLVLTSVALYMLSLPYLKLIGSLFLFWIALKLQMPESKHNSNIESKHTLKDAIRTIVLADLVMSLDNVLAVAASAKGNVALLLLGLGMSIPLVIFGSTVILRMMERYPSIITIGAALLGYAAGEMFIEDPVFQALALHEISSWLVPLFNMSCALGVVVAGKWLIYRKSRQPAVAMVDLAAHDPSNLRNSKDKRVENSD